MMKVAQCQAAHEGQRGDAPSSFAGNRSTSAWWWMATVVMVENIVRHLGQQEQTTKSIADRIRDAAHDVQRPVFYAITIIITAYLPNFTLQRVEGRLFRPMARRRATGVPLRRCRCKG